MSKELSRNAKCGCGSDKKYKHCCHGRGFRFVVDEKGEVFKEIPLHEKAVEIIESSKKDFIEKFGREPGDNDPLFFDFFTTEDDYLDRMSEMLEKIGTRPEIIYAFRKTKGFVLTEHNKDLASPQDIQEWKDAIKEYRQKQKQPVKETIPKWEKIFMKCVQGMDDVLHIEGLLIYKSQKFRQDRSGLTENQFSPFDYFLFCLTKTIKSTRGLLALLANNFTEDALNLTRSVYENYLNTAYVLKHPEEVGALVEARIGFHTGAYTYATDKNGKIDRKNFVEVKTGIKVKTSISNREMAKVSGHDEDIVIYEFLYDFLSRYTHPDVMSLFDYYSENGFDHLKQNPSYHPLVFCLFINCLILHEACRFNEIDETTKKDIERFINKHKKNLAAAFTHLEKTFKGEGFPTEFKARVLAL